VNYDTPIHDPVVVKDFVGQEIKPGCSVVYPTRRGSSMWMNKMTVDLVEDSHISGFNNVGRRVNVTTIKNCVVVPNN
jgi:hypothetical protein